MLRRTLSRGLAILESSSSSKELEQAAKLACQKAQQTGKPEDHQAAIDAHKAVGDSIMQWLSGRGQQYSARMGAHGDCEDAHKQRIKGTTSRLDLMPFMYGKGKATESVATTIYYDFYGNRTGINNRIPICPDCSLPVNETFGNRHPMASGLSALQCQCQRMAKA